MKNFLTSDSTTQQSFFVLAFSFILIIVLFFIVTSVGISHIKGLSNNLSIVVNELNLRTHLAHTMRNASRERSMLLLEMTQTEDPFERDDIYIKMGIESNKYLVAREEILKTKFSEGELELLNHQHKQTIKGVIKQNNVLGLLANQEFASSQKTLLEEAIPLQNKVIKLIDKFIDKQQENSNKILDSARSDIKNALRNIIILATIGILISSIVAVYVIRRITLTLREQLKAEDELVTLNNNLEIRIDERTSELKEVNQKLQHLASYDITTGLPNRVFFNDVAERILITSIRYKFDTAIFFLDLDGFKNINDNFGHDVGDGLLKQVSQRVQSKLRKGDVIARIGGDEFSIILGNVQNKENIIKIAKKILQSISEPFDVSGNICRIGVSIGISIYPENGENIKELIKSADDAMYITKKNGKNNYTFA